MAIKHFKFYIYFVILLYSVFKGKQVSFEINKKFSLDRKINLQHF